MSRTTRVLLTLFLCVTLLMATTVGVTVAAVYRAGTIAVEVSEDQGSDLRLAVPAGLVRLGVWLTPASVIEPLVCDEIGPFLPALEAGWRELSRTPDFVLADVRDRHDHVRIEKRGDDLVVEVTSDGSSVRVALPLRTVGPMLAKLERAAALRS
jgi:hypothetical protein